MMLRDRWNLAQSTTTTIIIIIWERPLKVSSQDCKHSIGTFTVSWSSPNSRKHLGSPMLYLNVQDPLISTSQMPTLTLTRTRRLPSMTNNRTNSMICSSCAAIRAVDAVMDGSHTTSSTSPAEAATSLNTTSLAMLKHITHPHDPMARFCQQQRESDPFTVVGLGHGETLNCRTCGRRPT